MMKKYLNITVILSIALLAFGLSGCYEQEVVPPIKPGGLEYTSATFTTDFSGNEVTEGDTINYHIKLSKPLEYSLTFTVKTNGNPDDIEVHELTIPAYKTEGDISIIFVDDNIPEKDQQIKLEVGVFDIGHKYMLSETKNPVLDLTLINKNDPDGLSIAVAWPDSNDDWDAYLIDENGEGIYGGRYDWVGWAGATGADPEVMVFKDRSWVTVPNGVYYVDVDPYAVENDKTNFKISVGYPDQTVEFFEFTFDKAKAGGGEYPITWGYSTLKIVKNGMNYDCSLLPQYSE
jgi:hypothetical protein